jgi:hypothetical protein
VIDFTLTFAAGILKLELGNDPSKLDYNVYGRHPILRIGPNIRPGILHLIKGGVYP